MDFAEALDQTNFSMFPLDLKTVNSIMDKFFMYVRMYVCVWCIIYVPLNHATCIHPVLLRRTQLDLTWKA